MKKLKEEIKIHRWELGLIILHLAIGLGVYYFNPLARFLGIFSIIIGLLLVYNSKNRNNEVLIICGYLVGSDVFFRMTGGVFFYEQIKYAIILFMFLGILFKSASSTSFIYFIYIILLIPAIFIASNTLRYDIDLRKSIAFNLSGPICLGVSAIYCIGRKVTFRQIRYILLFILLPILSMAIYLFFYSPNLQDVITGTQSNFEASGGFGPNQVSTILGLGMFILITRFFMYSDTVFWKFINGGALIFLTYRALLTFSRGGVISAVIISSIFILIVLYYLKENSRKKMLLILGVFGFILFLTWGYSNLISGGLLEKRYNNQDATGREKADLTTGRSELIVSELQAFSENPILGVGVGNNKHYRLDTTGIESASHNEISRILAEHGSLGLVAFIILTITPVLRFFKRNKNVFFLSFFLFWLFTINHSAMRIAAPAFIYGLSLLTITSEKNTLYRKQVSKKT